LELAHTPRLSDRQRLDCEIDHDGARPSSVLDDSGVDRMWWVGVVTAAVIVAGALVLVAHPPGTEAAAATVPVAPVDDAPSVVAVEPSPVAAPWVVAAAPPPRLPLAAVVSIPEVRAEAASSPPPSPEPSPPPNVAVASPAAAPVASPRPAPTRPAAAPARPETEAPERSLADLPTLALPPADDAADDDGGSPTDGDEHDAATVAGEPATPPSSASPVDPDVALGVEEAASEPSEAFTDDPSAD
jgi:hypothetical protein